MADEAGLLKAVTNVTSEPPIEQGQMFDSNERAAVLEDFVSQLRPLVEQTDDQKVMEETVRTTIQLLDVSSREPWIDQASAVHIAPLEEDGKRLGSFKAALFQCNLKENIGFAENAADSAFVAVGQQLISARFPGLRIDRYGSQHAKNAVEALRRTAHSHLARNNAEFFDRKIQQNSRFTFRDGLFNAMSKDFVDIPADVLQEVYLGKLRQSCNDGDISRTAAGDWLILQGLCDAFKISIILVLQEPQGAPSYVHFEQVGDHQNAAFTCFLSYASGTFQSLSRTEGISMTVERETVTRTETRRTIESPIQTTVNTDEDCDALKVPVPYRDEEGQLKEFDHRMRINAGDGHDDVNIYVRVGDEQFGVFDDGGNYYESFVQYSNGSRRTQRRYQKDLPEQFRVRVTEQEVEIQSQTDGIGVITADPGYWKKQMTTNVGLQQIAGFVVRMRPLYAFVQSSMPLQISSSERNE